MKRILYFICLMIVSLGFTSCGGDDDDPVVKPTQTGTMTDNDGNQYKWVRIGGLDWMAENLNSGAPYYLWESEDEWGDYGYTIYAGDRVKSATYYKTFANYYTYKQALDNAPEGWRLPTDDDWKALEKELGVSDVDQMGWRNGGGLLMVQTLEQGTGLNLRFGGELCRRGSPYYLQETHIMDYGMYWTATEDKSNDVESVIFRRILPYQDKVERNICTIEDRYLSVRYVRDAK